MSFAAQGTYSLLIYKMKLKKKIRNKKIYVGYIWAENLHHDCQSCFWALKFGPFFETLSINIIIPFQFQEVNEHKN